MNDLSNISAISMVAIEESRMGNLTTLTATRLEEPDPLEALDMSKMPTEMFLDGCKVSISPEPDLSNSYTARGTRPLRGS